MFITNAIATHLSSSDGRKYRAAARLWASVKMEMGNNDRINEKEFRAIAKKKGFSSYQFRTYKELLLKCELVGLDRHGMYYFRSTQSVTRKLTGMDKKFKTTALRVSDEHTKNNNTWLTFLSAIVVGVTARSIRAKIKKRYRLQYVGDSGFSPVKTEASTPVSLSILSKKIKASDATSSRMRTRAAKAGYITNDINLLSFGGNKRFSRQDWLYIRAEHNANNIILKDGLLSWQLPNLVATTPKCSFSKFSIKK